MLIIETVSLLDKNSLFAVVVSKHRIGKTEVTIVNIKRVPKSCSSMLYIILCHTSIHVFTSIQLSNDFSYLNTFSNEKVHKGWITEDLVCINSFNCCG